MTNRISKFQKELRAKIEGNERLQFEIQLNF